MKKNEKIMIGILGAILVIMIGVLFISKREIKQDIGANVDKQSGKMSTDLGESNEVEELGRIIQVNGELYYDTGMKSSIEYRCGVMDGKIISNVPSTQTPTENNQANFEGKYEYQYGMENTIEVFIDNNWIVFETRSHSFYGTVKQTESNCIFVEPKEGETIRKSADLILIGLKNDDNTGYKVGDTVKVTYDGYIMETYPVQVNAIKLEKQSSNELTVFTIKVYDKSPKTDEKIHKILDKSETDKYDYNIYAYNVNVDIIVGGKEISLRDALLNNKVNMEEIIAKANLDIQNPIIYKDGGSKEYHYDLYTIIKCNKLDGNKDVYIGMPNLNINDVM